MVNYCCVSGCDRNSRSYQRLSYFTLPNTKDRLLTWLKAIGRMDLFQKDIEKLQSYRVCSWHFPANLIKSKSLSPDAVPTLNLPTTVADTSKERKPHADIVCNDCVGPICGFRYKCVTCPDFDLCDKCEAKEKHSEHCMLRIPAPVKNAICEDLTKKWQEFFKAHHFVPEFNEDKPIEISFDSSDDEPILSKCSKTKKYDSGIEISEDEKILIRNEVNRMLKAKKKNKETGKSAAKGSKVKKRQIVDAVVSNNKQAKPSNNEVEVAFAAVDEFKEPQSMKTEVMNLDEEDNVQQVQDGSSLDAETGFVMPQLAVKYNLAAFGLDETLS